MSFPLIPETAPFSSRQRAWLNGYFAGIVGVGQAASLPAPASAVAIAEPPNEAEEELPWHDPALPLDERLKLAEGKPLASRLMAAMAQLDCGACGYVCQTYSAAIAAGEEQDLTRCSPGGSPTAKMLKQIVAEAGSRGSGVGSREGEAPAGPCIAATSGRAGNVQGSGFGVQGSGGKQAGYSRSNPFTACIAGVKRLTHLDAPKDTRHVAIDLLDSGLVYESGDALGVCPVNCPDLVRGVLEQLRASGDEPVADKDGVPRPLRQWLDAEVVLNHCPSVLLESLAAAAQDSLEAGQLQELAASDGGPLAGADLCELLERFPSARPPLADLVAALPRLQPRLYSISSSHNRYPNEVHLTVGVVRFESAGRWRNGVASHFLGVRSSAGDPVRVFVHSSPKFRLPADSSTPIIMVGPGTGIAPFMGFLQEREAIGAPGKNWLIFGNQYFDMDFLYREELDRWADGGLLTRLDVAFSRDSAEKVYVQHRMREQGAELWSWLEAGAHFYVCGDSKRMAPDVDAELVQIAIDHGRLTREEAKAYTARLVKEHRYQRDVY
jgi:sulfite reductase (NADPH) flavoprotein alpha-component